MNPKPTLRQGFKHGINVYLTNQELADDATSDDDDRKPAALPSLSSVDGSTLPTPTPGTPIRGLSYASVAARKSAVLEVDDRRLVPASTSSLVNLALPSSPCPPMIRRSPRETVRPIYNETLLGKITTKTKASPSTPAKTSTKKQRILSPEKPSSVAAAAAVTAAVLDVAAAPATDETAELAPADIAVESSTTTSLSTEEFPPLVCLLTQPTDADAPKLKDPPPPSTEPK
jgi:hypothetical protein